MLKDGNENENLQILKVSSVSNPISQAYIGRTINPKNNLKMTNKLISNGDMTKEEAMKAKKQL